MNRIILISLVAIAFGIVFFIFASSIMIGYQDCSVYGGLSFCTPGSVPANCAERETLLYRDILEYCGTGLILFSAFFPLLITYREKQSLNDETSSILSLR